MKKYLSLLILSFSLNICAVGPGTNKPDDLKKQQEIVKQNQKRKDSLWATIGCVAFGAVCTYFGHSLIHYEVANKMNSYNGPIMATSGLMSLFVFSSVNFCDFLKAFYKKKELEKAPINLGK
ncbi:MAG: hypothetical protein WDZ41_04915 [Candidatus Babeliales bacterium]